MSDEQFISVSVTRQFSASAEQVFDAWLHPQAIGQWMFGPKLREEQVLRIEVDPRVGGKFSFVVLRGGQELDHTGVYREIVRPRRLVFTWGVAGHSTEESFVAIDIVSLGDGCELTLTHCMDPKWAEYAERTQAGWTKMLAALAGKLEG